LTARYNMSLRHLGLAAISAFAAPVVLFAQARPIGQVNRAPDKDATQIMITSFKSVEKGPGPTLGSKAAEEMRDKVDRAFPPKQVYVVPVERINPQLEASQFPTTESLEPHDAKALATMLRSDEYVAGEITKVGTGFRVTADLVLTRDISARQPLGIGEAPKMGDALNMLVKEMKEARKQMDGEKKCMNAARAGNYPQAIEFANAAILVYPKATLARMCLVSVLNASKAPSAEIAKVSRELVMLDPRSNVGLKYLADAYRADKQSDSLVTVLTQMMRNDPKNAQLAFDAVSEIAGATNPGLARPIIDSAIVLNPGDPDLLKTRWQILNAMKDWKEMRTQGTELLRLDTAFADTLYFLRTAASFTADSQWQQAAATAAQGVAKFPTNAQLVGFEIQFLQRAGQQQQALDKLDKAVAGKIPVPQAGALKLTLLQELNKTPAEIVTAAREAISAGDTTENVRFILVNQGNAQFSAAQKLGNTDIPAATEAFNTALATLAYADSVAMKAQKAPIAFLKGASYILLANLKYQAAGAQKSCALAKEAKSNVIDGQINLPGGASPTNAATMQQLMGIALQLDPALDTMIKQLACK